MTLQEKIILLVEDNPDDEALAVRALRKNNILNKVVVARDGQEALDYLWGQGAHKEWNLCNQPTVVLLDLNLPKLSGLEVLEQIRNQEATKLLPVVVLTTSRGEEDMLRSYELGANSYVRKPVDFVEFAEAVKQLGLYWLLINQTPAPRKEPT